MINYKISYLPIFEKDLENIIDYIALTLNNPHAANELLNKVEHAIKERSKNPLSFEPFISSKEREFTYYRIYVEHFVIFYVVIEDIIEIRRIFYNKRNITSLF